MSLFSKLKAKRNFRENQADKILKYKQPESAKIEPYVFVGIDLQDASVLNEYGSIVGSQKMIQKISTMNILVHTNRTSFEDDAFANTVLTECGVSIIHQGTIPYVMLHGSIASFYAYANICIKCGISDNLVYFVLSCLAVMVDYDVWFDEQKYLIINYSASSVYTANDREINVSRAFNKALADMELVQMKYKHDDPRKKFAMAIADTYLITTEYVLCYVKKCIASCYINSLKDDEWEYEYPEENEEEILQKEEDE